MYERQYGAETQEYLNSISSLRPNDKSNATPGTDHKPKLPMHINGIGAQTLAETPLSEPEWLVDKLLCTESLCVLASAPKAGKSYLALQLGAAVSTGKPFFGYETRKAGVLYLALEDRFNRVQNRLWAIADELSDDFEIETKSLELGNGLIDELDEYIARKTDTKLFIIDTLQVVRGEGNDCHYSSDYGDIRKLVLGRTQSVPARPDPSAQDVQQSRRVHEHHRNERHLRRVGSDDGAPQEETHRAGKHSGHHGKGRDGHQTQAPPKQRPVGTDREFHR